ncbi:hypothetical protein [Sulfuriferula plumbiphila]|uniref:hypothetical protein n=1 Tax=Sulfuriferula plumbiphila TaxID=171865 RepID=UPI002FCD5A72
MPHLYSISNFSPRNTMAPDVFQKCCRLKQNPAIPVTFSLPMVAWQARRELELTPTMLSSFSFSARRVFDRLLRPSFT